ncbi:hypothetical protein LTR17_016391 [Elasticomyces elasticus]|nr:hypothetical protein LTR17_016391 [Elasticomyces elasticus]
MTADNIDATALMPLDTPVLKVSRPVAACTRCRNAKIKCVFDGKLPACSSCEKNGRAAECTSTNDHFARGKERSYVSTLETRIDRLQAKLQEARNRKPSVVSIPDDETAAPSRRQSYSVQEPTTPITSKAQRRKETSAIDDLVSDFGYLSVNATARDFHGFTSAMSYARLILSACTKDPLPQGTTKALPARYAATALIQHYLNNIFVLLPVFDEATFYASVENVYSKHVDQADPLDHWMVHMVLAISNVSMSEQRGDHQYLEGIGHVCTAIGYAEDVLHPGAISSVQALVLLTEYAMLDPHHLDSWSLIGAASRAMLDLGLHQDPPKGSAMAKSKLELRRRVFHCVYALDRSTSLVQTRAFSFSDDSAKVKIPFTKAPASQATPLSQGSQKPWLQSYEQALDLINLRQLQSTWYTDLFQSGRTAWEEPYPYIWDTCDALRKWFENISPSTSQNMRAFFEVDLLYSYIYVLSPSPRVPAIDPFAAKLIFEYCIRYADLMLRLISDPSYTAPMTFYDAMRVYMTGRQFLDVLQHSTDSLLNGFVPNHPPVRPTSAPPPPMPVMPLPPGDTILHFNTARSLHCIKQITDSLTRFGMRWGYMSWSQRYQAETAGMLEELTRRLREMDEMSGRRRPSTWQHTSSTGSVHSMHSSSGSIHFSSPQSLPPGPAAYRQPSITAYNMTSYGSSGQPPLPSPQQHHYAASSIHQQPVQPFDPQQGQFHGQAAQQYSYIEPPPSRERHPNFNVAPSQQFAGWGGYGGPTAPGPLDEDAATHQERLEIAPWIDTDPQQVSPTTKVPPASSLGNLAAISDHGTIRGSQSGDSSDTQSDGGSLRRRRRSILDSLIPSRLSKRRKNVPKRKPPTSAPRQSESGPSLRSVPSQSTVNQVPTRPPAPLPRSQQISQGSLGLLPDTGQENWAPDSLLQGSAAYPFAIPATSMMPPLGGTGPGRRPSSMQDYATELFSDLILPGMMSWDHAAQFQNTAVSLRNSQSPRQIRREGHKGKQPVHNTERGNVFGTSFVSADPASLLDPAAYNYPAPPPPEMPGFMTIPGVGWSCLICNNVVQQPALHTTDGLFCFNAQWDPFNPLQSAPPASAGVDEDLARQQRMAGGTITRDFANDDYWYRMGQLAGEAMDREMREKRARGTG